MDGESSAHVSTDGSQNGTTPRTGLAEMELKSAAMYQTVEDRRITCSNRGRPGSEDAIVT